MKKEKKPKKKVDEEKAGSTERDNSTLFGAVLSSSAFNMRPSQIEPLVRTKPTLKGGV